MLHATAKNKSTLYRRYFGERDGDERKVYEEDEITSTIFGPLDFLCASDAHRFWLRVLESEGQPLFLPVASPQKISVAMWPRDSATDNGNSIEPDMVITMEWADGDFRILLIELKWRAPLSGSDQLHRQWLHYLDDEQRAHALHIFIAREISAGAQALNNEEAGGNVWITKRNESRIVLLPWLRIRAVLDDFSKEDSALGRWAKLADQFLDRIQIGKFSGFNNFSSGISVPLQSPSNLFWSSTHSPVGASSKCLK
jgi:hypothetical protein